MPAFCTHSWGSCPEGGKHACDGYVVLSTGRHAHHCGKCGADKPAGALNGSPEAWCPIV